MDWLIASLAGLLAGIFSAMGMGGGGVLVIYLTLFAGMEQSGAQGINLIFFIPCALVAIAIHAKKKLIDWKKFLLAAALGLPAAFLGTQLADLIGDGLLKKLFGGLLVVMAVRELFFNKKEDCGKKKKSNRESERAGH